MRSRLDEVGAPDVERGARGLCVLPQRKQRGVVWMILAL